MSNSFKDDAQIRALVRSFETCEIHPAEFKHYQHLAVALWYVAHLPYEDAGNKMRAGIQRLAAAYGKTGYHETITIFWLRMVREFFKGAKRGESITTLANLLVQKFDDKNLIRDYYSAELLASSKAKEEWVEPDLKPLPITRES
jgi:hypothetical protein